MVFLGRGPEMGILGKLVMGSLLSPLPQEDPRGHLGGRSESGLEAPVCVSPSCFGARTLAVSQDSSP